MGLTFTQSPTSGTESDGLVTLSARVQASGDYVVTGITIRYRINSGTWHNSAKNQTTTDLTHTVTLSLTGGGDTVEWLYYYRWTYLGTPLEDYNPDGHTWTFDVAIDSANPTINSALPADSSTICPDADGKCDDFSVNCYDAHFVDYAELWVGGVLKDTIQHVGITSLTWNPSTEVQLNKGATTYYWKVFDFAAHSTTLATRNITVGNVAPTIPGLPSVEGLSSVTTTKSYTVSWTAATDNNPEDTLTYKLEVKYNAGGWNTVASGISGLTQAWTPTTTGTAYLRVSAYDGTTYGSLSPEKSITVVTTAAPNTPTITAPSGTPWKEGTTQSIAWTAASPVHPDGLSVTYEGEFSSAGTFADTVAAFSGDSASPYSWTLPLTLVASDTATCKLRVRARDTNGNVSAWSTSGAFTVQQESVPTVSLVTPAVDGDTIAGLSPTLVFLVDDAENDAIHIELEICALTDFASLLVDSDSTVDYADWEQAPSPFTSWATLTSGGATHDYRVRYQMQTVLRYDRYYARVRVKDSILTGDWLVFSFVCTYSGDRPLEVLINSLEYPVTGLVVTEETNGGVSDITIVVPLSDYLANPVAVGDAVTLSASINNLARTWNAQVEDRRFRETAVEILCLQDDVYLSRRLCTGNETTEDIGKNLQDFVVSYGAPLDGANIDTATGVSLALTGGYKSLREHFDAALDLLPAYVYWVDETGSAWFKDQADFTASRFTLIEADPTE